MNQEPNSLPIVGQRGERNLGIENALSAHRRPSFQMVSHRILMLACGPSVVLPFAPKGKQSAETVRDLQEFSWDHIAG